MVLSTRPPEFGIEGELKIYQRRWELTPATEQRVAELVDSGDPDEEDTGEREAATDREGVRQPGTEGISP